MGGSTGSQMGNQMGAYTPTVTGSGGGGPGTTGSLVWGPNFGNNEAEGTWVTAALSNIVAMALTGQMLVTAAPSIAAVEIGGLQENVSAAIAFDTLTLAGELPVTAALQMPALELVGELPVTAAPTISALSLVNTSQVNASLTGIVTSAPFWLSVQTAAHTGAGNITDLACNVPAGWVTDDLLVAFCTSQTGLGAEGDFSCTGWTKIGATLNQGVSAANSAVFYRLASSEPTSYTFNHTVAAPKFGVEIHLVRGVDTTTPINVNAGDSSSGDVDPVLPTVTTTVANCLVMGFLCHVHALTQTHTAPAGNVERTEFESGAVVPFYGSSSYTKVFAAAASTGTAVVDCNNLVATSQTRHRIAIAPGAFTI